MRNVSNSHIRSLAFLRLNTHFGRVAMLSLANLLPLFSIYLCLLPLTDVADTRNSFANAGSSLLLALALMALSYALMCVMLTGTHRGLQQLAEDQPVKGGVLFSRIRHALGSIGLPLWIYVKTYVWALPGEAVVLLGTSLMLSSPGFFATLVRIAGFILMYALMIPAALRYSMAHYVFAEHPELGVYDAVERSKDIMCYRKWQLFCLNLPYVLGIVGIWAVMAGVFLVAGGVGPTAMVGFVGWLLIMLTVAAIAGTVYLLLLSVMATACYYNAHKPQPAPEQEEAPAQPAE